VEGSFLPRMYSGIRSIGPGRKRALAAAISSNLDTLIWRHNPCMPELSNWKTPIVRPLRSSLNVSSSSRGTFSTSKSSMPGCCRMCPWASEITDSVFSPRKSILSRPISATVSPSKPATSPFIALAHHRYDVLKRFAGDQNAGGVLAGIANQSSSTCACSKIVWNVGLEATMPGIRHSRRGRTSTLRPAPQR